MKAIPSTPADPITGEDWDENDDNLVLSMPAQNTTSYSDLCPTIPLFYLFTTAWDADIHFTAYSCSLEQRLRKDALYPDDTRFEIACADLDWDKHQSTPSDADWSALCRTLWIIDEIPNVVYRTRQGARLIYFIEPMYKSLDYEAHLTAFLHRLSCHDYLKYGVDLIANDWTRLYRAPNVVRDGRVYRSDVRYFHSNRFDLHTLQVRVKPPHKVIRAQTAWVGNDGYLARLERAIQPGTRNDTLFRMACHIYRAYKNPQAALEKLYNFDLPQAEIKTIIASASRYLPYQT